MKISTVVAFIVCTLYGSLYAQCDGVFEEIAQSKGRAYLCFSSTGNDYVWIEGRVVTKPEVIAAAFELSNAYDQPKIKEAIEMIKKELK